MTVLPAVLLLAAGTMALRLAGPALIGDRAVPTWLRPAAVGAIAGMIVLGTLDGGGQLALDARVAGVGAALVALALRLPLAGVILAAVAVTALVRLAGWG